MKKKDNLISELRTENSILHKRLEMMPVVEQKCKEMADELEKTKKEMELLKVQNQQLIKISFNLSENSINIDNSSLLDSILNE